jgi:hypothetical protein
MTVPLTLNKAITNKRIIAKRKSVNMGKIFRRINLPGINHQINSVDVV